MSRPLIEYARSGLPLTDVPVFDMHAHLDGGRNLAPCPPDEHVRIMDRIGINVAAISSCFALMGAHLQRGNDSVAAACAYAPDRFIGYCHVSGNYPDLVASELRRCFANPCFKGIKLYQHGVDFTDPVFAPVWTVAAELGVPVMSHTWGGSFTGLDKIAAQHPEVNFIFAHAGSGFVFEPYIAAALASPNIYLDLTYSREHPGMIEEFVARVGQDRIVWGTDFNLFSMAHQIGKVLYAKIDDNAKRAILHHNAARLFKLPPANSF